MLLNLFLKMQQTLPYEINKQNDSYTVTNFLTIQICSINTFYFLGVSANPRLFLAELS